GDNGDAGRLLGYAFQCFCVLCDERWFFHQVTWRVSADRQFGKENEIGSQRLGSMAVFNDLRGISAEISHRGIDLAESDLHFLKCKTLGRRCHPGCICSIHLHRKCNQPSLSESLTGCRKRFYTPLFSQKTREARLAQLDRLAATVTAEAAADTLQPLRPHPQLYEISALPWLVRLSRRLGRRIGIADVPHSEW